MALSTDISEGAALLNQEEEDEGQAPPRRQVLKKRAGVWAVSVVGTIAAVASLGWHGRHPAAVGAAAEFQVKQMAATAQCPNMEENVEYVDETSGFGQNFDHIPTPDLCCALCQANDQCQSFTWVKDAQLDGCPSQCWIKGGTGIKTPGAFGKVSGIPPPKPQMGAFPPGQGGPGNSLWCFSLMTPNTGEQDLITWQFNNQASIFACDAYAVYSNEEIQVAPGVTTRVVQSDLKCGYGGDSQSALNSWIFIAVWDKICDDREYGDHQWVVKVDPDCVFFPNRLVQILPIFSNAQVIENCKYGMHGPIEIFSTGAIDALAAEYASSFDGKTPKRCVTDQDFGQWGEDMFIDQCLTQVLGLTQHPLEPRVICENHCNCPDFYWCQKGSDRVSYHPFKTVGDYSNCIANAMLDQNPSVIAAELQQFAPTR